MGVTTPDAPNGRPGTGTNEPHAGIETVGAFRTQSGLRGRDLVTAILLPIGIVTAPWYLYSHFSSAIANGLMIIAIELFLLFVASRQLGKYSERKLSSVISKAPRELSRDISPNELKTFQDQINAEIASPRFSEAQLNLFAVSIADPAVLRRRVTDVFSTRSRTLDSKMIIEFDLNAPLISDSTGSNSARDEDDKPEATTFFKRLGDGPRLLAILMPRKGHLHDNSRITDGGGRLISALAYKEYRVLMGLTLRRLLISAFGKYEQVPDEVWNFESDYLELLLQYGVIKDGARPTTTRITEVLQKFKTLERVVPEEGKQYFELLMRLVQTVAVNYAVVAVVPSDVPARFFLIYESTEIPGLQYPKKTFKTVGASLRTMLGAKPSSLRVSAANAMTCQSYHLIASTPEDQYLADLDAPFISRRPDQVQTDSRVSYYRVRGRRGQHYFHLYSRLGGDAKPSGLRMDLRFAEVPPGSIGRAAVSALACFITCAAVAYISALPSSNVDGRLISAVDSNVAVFLLALPGIAAVWLGFEGGESRLFGGAFAAKVSLVLTFVLSVSASILLLFQKAEVIAQVSPGEIVRPHLLWLVLVAVAAANAAMLMGLLWERAKYYRTVATRSTTESSFAFIY